MSAVDNVINISLRSTPEPGAMSLAEFKRLAIGDLVEAVTADVLRGQQVGHTYRITHLYHNSDGYFDLEPMSHRTDRMDSGGYWPGCFRVGTNTHASAIAELLGVTL